MNYLDTFANKLSTIFRSSLIRVSDAIKLDRNAKKYLSQLAKAGRIEKVAWGWYCVPDSANDFFKFMATDKNFKVLHKQSAASFWNGDFVHREQFSVAVRDKSFAPALLAFTKTRGWNVSVEVRQFKPSQYVTIDGLHVEALEDTIIDCLKSWAFADAFSSLQLNRKRVSQRKLSLHYWERIPRSNVRVGQILQYESSTERKLSIADDFLRRQVEEAAERVSEFG